MFDPTIIGLKVDYFMVFYGISLCLNSTEIERYSTHTYLCHKECLNQSIDRRS
jgi:hypothetical protein